MNTIPLSDLAPTTRARLEALAVEWLGINPWGDRTPPWRDCGDPAGRGNPPLLPLDFGAGFDLGVRLYAELEHISVADAHANLRDDPMRIGVETPADRQPEARLRVMLLDLGRN